MANEESRPDGSRNEEGDAGRLPSSDELFRLLFEEVPCYCCILDREFNIVSVNRRCRENFTTPFSRRCYQVFKGRSEICPDCPAVITMKDARVSESVELLIDRSGREVEVICRTIPIEDEAGEVSGVLHMSVRAGQAEKLQLAMTSLDSQIGSVSHGIKGLLTAMVGGFYMWDSGLETNKPDRMEKGIQVVRRSFHRLQHLAHDVLYYVRDRRTFIETLDGVEILRKKAGEMQEDWSFAGARIVLPDDLSLSTIFLEADRRALESMLVNLIVNSLDDCRTDKRDIDHHVDLSVREEGDFVHFCVADNGIGMDKETLDKLFSLFFDPKGIEVTGMGLYVANKLARVHDGSVKIESEPGKGTRYELTLPKRQSGEIEDDS